MDFKDASARFKSKKAQEKEVESVQPKGPNLTESYRIRAKMLGVLLRDARLNAERSIEECAYLLRVTAAEMQAWEFGEAVPSLPQIELLAYYLGVPVSHFWGSDTLESKLGRHIDIQVEYLALRNRMVGALLRQARDEASLSLDELSQMSGVSAEQLTNYEMGELALPMHELTVLASAVKKNINYFLESSGHVGEWLATREQWKHFSDLPEDVRQFAANPLNLGFIHIAKLLSEMPTDRLRQVGESVLNITM